MESRPAGALRLFIIMIFFGVSIFFLNNNKKNFTTATHIDVLHFKVDSMLSVDKVYQEMSALFVAHDIDLIIKVMRQFKHRFAYDLVKKLIADDSVCLSVDEKKTILYGMIAHAHEKKQVQYELFDLLLHYPIMYKKSALLLSLVRSQYGDLIPVFIAWGKERQKKENKNGLLSEHAEQAFVEAIKDNDAAVVEQLFIKKVRLSQNKASELLWYIVENDKNGTLIPLLINHAQANINYAEHGKTLLIAAVEKNRLDIIRVLLDEGAVVDRVIDNEQGTALQIAMKHNYHSAEQLLREYGAV